MSTPRFSTPRREYQDCPVHCGRRMVLRFNRDGRGFYGCHAYPSCRYTEPANIKEPDFFGAKNKKPLEDQ